MQLFVAFKTLFGAFWVHLPAHGRARRYCLNTRGSSPADQRGVQNSKFKFKEQNGSSRLMCSRVASAGNQKPGGPLETCILLASGLKNPTASTASPTQPKFVVREREKSAIISPKHGTAVVAGFFKATQKHACLSALHPPIPPRPPLSPPSLNPPPHTRASLSPSFARSIG